MAEWGVVEGTLTMGMELRVPERTLLPESNQIMLITTDVCQEQFL